MPLCAILWLAAATAPLADWPFPARDGTTWQYAFTREPEHDGAVMTRQVFASPKPGELAPLRMEDASNGTLQWTQFLKNENGAVTATWRRRADAKAEAVEPPVTLLPAKFETGVSWNFRGRIAGVDVTLPLKVLGEEDIQVPAGKFRAWHMRGAASGTVATTAEEWFTRGVGWVKETVTQRSPTGQLIGRHTLELTALPSINSGAVSVTPSPDSFEASLSTSTGGAPMDTISADALQIVARWRMRHFGSDTRVRAVWIAEDAGPIAAPEYKVDEATAIAAAPVAVGTFTLSRPADGWATGKYRVDFYLQNNLSASLKVTIASRAAPVDSALDF